jgi:YgiT-type zinc finger domain-containing protein
MICLICRQAEPLDGLTTILFERGEMRMTVQDVPARVCPSCGEAYVEEDIAVRLMRQADAMSASGTLDGVLDFGSNQPDDKIHS